MNILRASTIALMVSVFLWGILMGGIVYSNLVFVPVFLGDLPESSVVVTGRYGLNEAVFWMSLHPLLVVSLIATLALNWKIEARRKLILIATAAYLAALIVTSVYFVPELIAFSESLNSKLAKPDWIVRGWWWQRMSWLRGGVLGLSYIPLILALTSSPEAPEQIIHELQKG